MKNIKIKYFSEDYPKLKKNSKGDFIDLRINNIIQLYSKEEKRKLSSSELNLALGTDGKIRYYEGDIIKFGLGVAMELPEGYEAIVVPRSSTFKHWGFIQTNSMGIIDNSYCGNNDEWQIEFIATRDGAINRFDRVCQFRIQENQPKINFEEVEKLGDVDRGGFGSSGRN